MSDVSRIDLYKLLDRIGDSADFMDVKTAAILAVLRPIILTLTEREEFVINKLFGLNGESCRVAALAVEMDLSSSRVSQIRDKAIRKMRHPTRKDALMALVPPRPESEEPDTKVRALSPKAAAALDLPTYFDGTCSTHIDVLILKLNQGLAQWVLRHGNTGVLRTSVRAFPAQSDETLHAIAERYLAEGWQVSWVLEERPARYELVLTTGVSNV